MAKNYEHTIAYSNKWKTKTGEIGFSLTNDYLFRALLQRDELTLKALVSSFLRIDSGEIRDIEVTNPIVLGESIFNKEYHLDVKVMIDDNNVIDLEMQVVRHKGWVERTLVYLCREFSEINHGTQYSDVKGVWQISFCGFTLFKDKPEFYSEYAFVNKKESDQVYSDKLKISNVNLARIDLADEDDIKYGIADWARLFNAKRWEELKMLTKDNPTMEQAVSSIWYLSEDKKIRDEIWKREDNELIYRSMVEDLEEYEKIKDKIPALESKLEEIKRETEEAKQETEKAKQETEKAKQETETAKQETEKAKQESEKAKQESEKALAEKDAEIKRLKEQLKNVGILNK